MSKYKLCKQANFLISKLDGNDFIHAHDVEAFLEKAQVVYQDDGYPYWGKDSTVGDKPMQARIILIEPIKSLSREERAIGLLNRAYRDGSLQTRDHWREWLNDTKELLDEEK